MSTSAGEIDNEAANHDGVEETTHRRQVLGETVYPSSYTIASFMIGSY